MFSPARRDQIAESDAFASDLRKLVRTSAKISRETRQKIRARAFTGRPRTDLPLNTFLTAAAAYLAGAEDLSEQLKDAVGGRVRSDEPRIQRLLALRLRRIFEEFDFKIEPSRWQTE